MYTHISFLRGINVGGHKKIKMAELKTVYTSLGFQNVRTLLQTGNVIFDSEKADTRSLSEQIRAAIEQHFELDTEVIMRSPDQMQAILQDHPFSKAQLDEPGKISIVFLAQTPSEQAYEQLIQAHSGPETIHPHGEELYIFYENGKGRSKLTNNFIENKLKVAGTSRNWNTVNKIIGIL